MSAISKIIGKIKKTPVIRSVYSRLRSILWGYGLRMTYKEDFIEFIAQRRSLSIEKVRALVTASERYFVGGWGGDKYRQFTELALETFKPLYDEHTDKELIETYQFHAAFDFLRMISYSIPTRQDVELIISRLSDQKMVTVVDYGCGLAHRTIAVSRYLLERGVHVKLYLVDIRRELHVSFLSFLCQKYGINNAFIEITLENLYPVLPQHDYCDTVSVLEHIREPITVINAIDRALRPGGLFLALVDDCIEEMMHISPNLKAVRDRLAKLRYQKTAACCGASLFQKPVA